MMHGSLEIAIQRGFRSSSPTSAGSQTSQSTPHIDHVLDAGRVDLVAAIAEGHCQYLRQEGCKVDGGGYLQS